jgi:hypothetical protein
MSSLLHPRAAARIKAAFDTCELVARTVQSRRQILRKLRPKAAPKRNTMVYDGGTVRVVPDR